MIDHPEKRGRGPAHLGALYRWERDDDLPVVGRFSGVVLGVTKGADTLVVGLEDHVFIQIRYENLAAAIRIPEQ